MRPNGAIWRIRWFCCLAGLGSLASAVQSASRESEKTSGGHFKRPGIGRIAIVGGGLAFAGLHQADHAHVRARAGLVKVVNTNDRNTTRSGAPQQAGTVPLPPPAARAPAPLQGQPPVQPAQPLAQPPAQPPLGSSPVTLKAGAGTEPPPQAAGAELPTRRRSAISAAEEDDALGLAAATALSTSAAGPSPHLAGIGDPVAMSQTAAWVWLARKNATEVDGVFARAPVSVTLACTILLALMGAISLYIMFMAIWSMTQRDMQAAATLQAITQVAARRGDETDRSELSEAPPQAIGQSMRAAPPSFVPRSATGGVSFECATAPPLGPTPAGARCLAAAHEASEAPASGARQARASGQRGLACLQRALSMAASSGVRPPEAETTEDEDGGEMQEEPEGPPRRGADEGGRRCRRSSASSAAATLATSGSQQVGSPRPSSTRSSEPTTANTLVAYGGARDLDSDSRMSSGSSSISNSHSGRGGGGLGLDGGGRGCDGNGGGSPTRGAAEEAAIPAAAARPWRDRGKPVAVTRRCPSRGRGCLGSQEAEGDGLGASSSTEDEEELESPEWRGRQASRLGGQGRASAWHPGLRLNLQDVRPR